MAKAVFAFPKHWEDWVNVCLGLWLLISPWFIAAGEIAATQNAVLIGFLLIAAEVVTLSFFHLWEEWIMVALGAWLIISSVVLQVSLLAAVNFGVVGILVLALALYEIWDEHRHAAHPA